MRRVFNQYLAGRPCRYLVIIDFSPVIIRVNQARRGGDDLAQVQLNVVKQAALVQFSSELLALG